MYNYTHLGIYQSAILLRYFLLVQDQMNVDQTEELIPNGDHQDNVGCHIYYYESQTLMI